MSDHTLTDGIGEEWDVEELLEDAVFDKRTSFPTLCKHGCEVESDGHCSHGAPSLLVAAGLI